MLLFFFFVILFQNVKKKKSLLINKLLKKNHFFRWLWFFNDCVPVVLGIKQTSLGTVLKQGRGVKGWACPLAHHPCDPCLFLRVL